MPTPGASDAHRRFQLSDGQLETTAPADWGVPRSKTITWHDPMVDASVGASLSGLDFLYLIRDGKLPPPPMARTPDEAAYNPIGVVHGGPVCTLADSAAGCAVQSTLEARVAYTSIDINVTYLRPVTKDSGALRATGRTTKPGRRVAYATVEVTDGAGKLPAQATSSCLVMDNRASAG